MIRILVADDHAIVRQGLRQVLSGEEDFRVTGEASNHGEVMQHLRREGVDVVVLDVAMPGRSGIDTLKQIKAEFPRTPVLILSMYPEDQYAFRALKAGASGYLTKQAAADQIVSAIRTICRGRRYITPELAEELAKTLDHDPDKPPHEALSDREFQTLKLIAAGRTLQQIGDALALSPKTVSVYRARILAKLKLSTNAELTRYALERNLLE
ncbi:MAG: response regulator transcription factor [Burkholderiales bacterium]|nr:response regulator transcription factor [Burkholderiales bacterium]GIK86633.1 MAG: DNA-binding response regulator [Betaproteobacteria bacterium]